MEENAEEIIDEAIEVAGVHPDIDQQIMNELDNLENHIMNNQMIQNVHIPVNNQNDVQDAPPTGDSVIIIERDEHNTLQEFAHSIREAASLFSTYNKTLRLIESSVSESFEHWPKLTECVEEIAQHPRVTDKMKMRCFLINKDNVRTFQLLQENFKLDLDNLYFMGKMNLLHVSCDTGWSHLARELVENHQMNVNLPCPSLHMRPASLTPLMLAVGAGHVDVVNVLLKHPDTKLELKDSYGMTAVFHTCNHGHHRVGDQHGYFRRLWSWDLSQQQLDQMELLARDNALAILKLLIKHGADVYERDNTGASILTRAASVDNFSCVIQFLVETGCKVTENVINWIKVRNPDCTKMCETSLRMPHSLLIQSRAKIWSILRTASSQDSSLSYCQRTDILVKKEELPLILSEYIQCIT